MASLAVADPHRLGIPQHFRLATGGAGLACFDMEHVSSVDSAFYQAAEQFFPAQHGTALTYDDVSLATLYSDILPREANLETDLAPGITLPLPMISADMDTVTESSMAIAMALNGGLGLIHCNMAEETQIAELDRVKNNVHGLIRKPIRVGPRETIGEVLAMTEEKRFSFRTFPVVDEDGKLLGLLPGHVVRPRYAAKTVAEVMTKRADVHTIAESELGRDAIARADRFFTEKIGINKLLVVDAEDRLHGLFTMSDIERILHERKAQLKPARDAKFRLLCGVSVSATRSSTGELDRDRIVAHVGELVERGVDLVAVSTAHGHSRGVGDVVRLLRSEFRELPLMAGNVTSAAGVEFLAEAGANVVKIGQGPGSICTTRTVAGVGIPQLTALYVASLAAKAAGVKIVADGGITKSGDLVKALTLAHGVICGGLLAGCPEAPGQIMEIHGKMYKQYRGMGSHAAMQAGSAARYGHASRDTLRKVAAEGVEALKELSPGLDVVLQQLAGGVQSGMGYLGAQNLEELRSKARYVRVTPAGQRESGAHDVVEVKVEG
jgi:IMP dehydrogenase